MGGQLAGGIAHDFNTVLSDIMMANDFLLNAHKPTDPSFQDIMQIKQNATRAATLVRQLLACSPGGAVRRGGGRCRAPAESSVGSGSGPPGRGRPRRGRAVTRGAARGCGARPRAPPVRRRENAS